MEFSFSLARVKQMLKAINDAKVIPHIAVGNRSIDQIVLSFMNGIDAAVKAKKDSELPQELIEFYNDLPDDLFNSKPKVVNDDGSTTPASEIDPEDAWMHTDDDNLFLEEDAPEPDQEPEPKPEPEQPVEQTATPKPKGTPKKKATPKPKVTPKKKTPAQDPQKASEQPTPKTKKKVEEQPPTPKPKAKTKEATATPKSQVVTTDNVIDGARFYSFIDRIYLGYDITNCCIIVRDGKAQCTALSEELTIMVATETALDGFFNMDLGDLQMFRKYLSKHKKDNITVLLDPNDDRFLLLRTGENNNTTFKFKMADPDMLTGYDPSKNELTANGINNFVAAYDHSIVINPATMKSVLDHIVITNTDIVKVVVDAAGVV